MFELQKTLEKRYQIGQIFEVWHFPDQSDTLFKDYIEIFLKCKQEASSCPSHVTGEKAQCEYIENYYAKDGIRLNPENICINKVGRSCNKLILYSLWVRFSLRTDLPSYELISDPLWG